MDIRDIDNETPIEEQSEKQWLMRLIDNIKRHKEEQLPITFRIESIQDSGFLVKVEKLYALVPFRYMPWKYSHSLWELIFPSLVGKSFTGYVDSIKEVPARIYLKADASQFEGVTLPFEENETYTAIILQKSNTSLLIDLGYGFEWKYGSFPFRIHCLCGAEDEYVDMFPHYKSGDELNAVYVGKSIIGNNIFRYDGTRYFSKEHNLTGKEAWATLKRTKANIPYFKIDEKYFGKLLLDKNGEFGISHEILQKTLQALPNGQRLWCKIVSVTIGGLLQLKWCIHEIPPIEDILSIQQPDETAVDYDSPDISEAKKALLNKMVWCDVAQSSYPELFKVENQHTGILSMDVADYQPIPLSSILNKLFEVQSDQQVLCKVKGIYPNGNLKLQWIIQRDSHSEKYVFPNRFPQIKKYIITEQTKKQALVGQETWAKIKKPTKANQKIAWVKGLYPAILEEKGILQKNLLQYFSKNTAILCKVLGMNDDETLRIKWLLPESNTLPEIDELPTEQQIGEEGWAEIKRFLPNSNDFVAVFEEKYLAKIVIHSTIKANFMRDIIQKLPDGQRLFCRIKDIENDILLLEWQISKDTGIDDLPILQPELDMLKKIAKKINKKEQKTTTQQEVIEQENTIEQKLAELKQAYLGKTLWLEAQKNNEGQTIFWIDDKYRTKIIVNKENYFGYNRKLIGRAIHDIPAGQLVLCKVLNSPSNFFELRWNIERDPYAKQFNFIHQHSKTDEDPEIEPEPEMEMESELQIEETTEETPPPKEKEPDIEHIEENISLTENIPPCEEPKLDNNEPHIGDKYRVGLKWETEEDPSAEMLLFATKYTNKKIINEEIQMKEEQTEKEWIENSPPTRENPEMIRIEVPVLKMPKILGKIDIDAINERTKPVKKTREELMEEIDKRHLKQKEERNARKNAHIAKREQEQEKKVEGDRETKRKRQAEKRIEKEEEMLASVNLQMMGEEMQTNKILESERCQSKSEENKPRFGEKISKMFRNLFSKK